ncbi:hypothetical protein F2P81_018435 [Scophthalmus maximus]|uniref:Uncharacterized protein n=1 Tax=Scophthalmus maximus TaxID=52904 RepID=A0A6A4SC70_SCOMX|nr:hypothetical protein F2P81_018435 [Scophthalmus maximus]
MDVECDCLVYGHSTSADREQSNETHQCPYCSVCGADSVTEHVFNGETQVYAMPEISFKEAASTGRMVPYLIAYKEEEMGAPRSRPREELPRLYNTRGNRIVALRALIHLRDVSPYGTWVSQTQECLRSITRLKRAGLACMSLPELNRMVLEQKNDDGLLHIMMVWLARAENANAGLETFGPFFCDAALTPVLHDILRSKWVAKRKEHCGSNGQLKPDWAQEFYDWTWISVTSTGAPVFVRNPRCPWGHKCKCERDRSELTTTVLNEMRWCGYTPWSAIHAVRCCEERLLGLRCSRCRETLRTYYAFLMEHAALEASTEGDWLVRNKAAQERQDSKRTLSHIERLAVLYAIDHLPLTSGKPESVSPLRSDAVDPADLAPDSRLSEVIMSNVPFTSAKRNTSSVPDEEDLKVSPVGETMLEVPDRMEVRNWDPGAIAEAMVSCFPRVSVSALRELTLKAPDPSALRSDPRILWPVFVNPPELATICTTV